MTHSFKSENGVLVMFGAVDESKPNSWYFYEIYASLQAYERHRQTEHFKLYISKTKDMLMAKEFIKISPFLLKNRGEFKFIKEQR